MPAGSEPSPVAVVIPARNEARHLPDAVRAIIEQDYGGPITICVAVGPSEDDTEAVATQLAAEHDNVRVVPNPAGTTPAGLNAAIRATSEPIVVRADGHCELAPDYVRTAVATLEETCAVNVGGVQQAVGRTAFERAVAAAVTSRFGTGGSRFRVGGEAGPVDTVYLGVFRRDALVAVGGFDETLIRNQDYELNIRLRDAGGVVWLDPALLVEYRPRDTLRGLARQYFEYGQWKREVLRRHPGSLQIRQAVPPLACAGIVTAALASLRFRWAAIAPALYAAAVVAGAATATSSPARFRLHLAVIYPTIHFSWAAGMLVGTRQHPGRGDRE